jgi:hypothetical protein
MHRKKVAIHQLLRTKNLFAIIIIFSIIFFLEFLLLRRYSNHLSDSIINSFKNENFEELSRGDLRSIIVKSNGILEKPEIISFIATLNNKPLIHFNRKSGQSLGLSKKSTLKIPFEQGIDIQFIIAPPPSILTLFYISIFIQLFLLVFLILLLSKYYELKLKRDQEIIALSRQIAHDLKPSLGILQHFLGTTPQSDSSLRATEALSKIKTILNDLVQKNTQRLENNTSFVKTLEAHVKSIISHHPNVSMKINQLDILQTKHLPSHIQKAIFRFLDVCIQNSLEAAELTQVKPVIEIFFILNQSQNKKSLVIQVGDQSGGISSALIYQLTHEPIQSKKPTGDGVGLYFLSEYLKQNQALLTLESPAKGFDTLISCEFIL